LIIAHKVIASAPRVLKEILWLTEKGWLVDTLGLGDDSPATGKHIPVRFPRAFERYLIYFVRSKRLRFWLLYERFLPQNFRNVLDEYDLVVIHEPTYLPSPDIQEFINARRGAGVHVDLHEDHVHSLSRNFLERFAFENYRLWELGHLARIFEANGSRISVSSVSDWISKVFTQYLKVPVATIRNAPAHQIISPSEVNLQDIQLVHHGVGTTHRGIEASIIAMRKIPKKYTLNFHLVAGPMYFIKITLLAYALGVSKRVRFRNPVPTRSISQTISQYDVALVVIPPVTENELNSLPNKFLESIQGRLAIVTGPNPSMADIVEGAKIGIVLNGWSHKDIAKGVTELETEKIPNYKNNCERITEHYSSLSDKEVFLKCVGNTLDQREERS
jgi:glycosyltransferase involved in cell wall biosynthesis